METITIEQSSSALRCDDMPFEIPAYAISLVEFCRLTHVGRATVLALIETGYLDAHVINGHVMILSGMGSAAKADLLAHPARKAADASDAAKAGGKW